MRAKKVKRLADLIRNLKKDISDYDGPIWYRGHSDSNWQLLPSFLRLNNPPSEMDLINKFKQNATILLNQPPEKLIEWLLIMQHNGVPTRLLDWTESPIIATFFAVKEKENKEGAIWILKPLKLNEEANIKLDDPNYLPSHVDDVLQTYSPESLYSERESNLLPIASIIPRNNQRMQAQQGVFTISHRDITPIEKIGRKKHVRKYLIPREFKNEILKELEMIKVGEFQLFPEISKLGEVIKGGL